MANLKSILDSVRVFCGIVHFPSRYAAREVMEALEDIHYFDSDSYRILAVKDSPYFVVYWSRQGILLDADDLSTLKSDLGL